MHLAERIIAKYGDTVEISDSFTGHVLFGFDLANPTGPVRVNVDATLHPSMRYISLSDMQARLEALIQSLKKNIVPRDLNLGGTFAAEWVLEAAQHVLNRLVAPPVRLSKRRELSTVINVVSGFENVIRCCTGKSDSEYPSMQWVLENVSSSGFGAVLSGRGADGLRIGSLLGIQTAGVARTGAAIVRRMLRDAEGRLHVGVEVSAHQVLAVTLRLSVGGGLEDGWQALLLHANVENGPVRLLMQADTFSMHRSLKVNFDGKNYLMIPVELQERSFDYDLASFRVVEQEETETQD